MYKFVVVLLCVLALSMSAQADCGPYGVLPQNSSTCLCISGYTGATCSQTFSAGCSSTVPQNRVQTKESYPYPNRFPGTYGFQYNKLFLSVLGYFVTNRTYTALTFVNAVNPSCSSGQNNTVWTRTMDDAPSCRDDFQLQMPWSMHADCGFALNNAKSTTSTAVFSSTILFSFIDRLSDLNGFGSSKRSGRVGFQVNVAFPKIVGLTLDNVQVTSNLTESIALTAFNYDVVAQTLNLTITSIMNWPNMLIPSTVGLITMPTHISQVGRLTVDSTGCTNSFNSRCVQIITFSEAFDNTVCTFDGTHVLSAFAATCRNSGACTNQTNTISFKVTGSNACGSVMATASVIANLVALPAGEDYTVNPPYIAATDPFILGAVGSFVTTIAPGQTGTNNTVASTYTSIFLVDNADNTNTPIVLYSNGFPTPAGTKASVVVDDSYRGFSIKFSPQVFAIDPFDSKSYTLKAAMSLTFLGNSIYNNKREIEQEEDVEEAESAFMVEEFLESFTSATAEVSPSTIFAVAKAPTVASSAIAVDSFSGLTNEVVAVAGAAALVAVCVVFAVVLVIRKRSTTSLSL